MQHSTGRPTKAQAERWEKMRQLGCICCRMQGIRTGLAIQIHHLLSGGRRMGHDETVACCSWHHVAQRLDGMAGKQMTAVYGPSLANGSKPFKAQYGTDAELLEYQNKLLEEAR